MKCLVTGGLGYIGSHVCVELMNNNHEIVIIDNLMNSSLNIFDKILSVNKSQHTPKLCVGDIRDINFLESVFSNHKFDCIFHFAALKSVNESNQKPNLYKDININGTQNLIDMMIKYHCNNFLFSSSCTVYGTSTYPVTEDTTTGNGLNNMYAYTKYHCEELLKKTHESNNQLTIVILRYFNPIGAHDNKLLGEEVKGVPNNIFPYILKVAFKELDQLTIFGDDYNTPDGTCVRDYIHIHDLADGHVSAMQKFNTNTIHIYNLGTGKGTSVKELINTFESINGPINKVIGMKRDGDLPEAYAITDKAYKELNWKAKRTIYDMCVSGIEYYKNKR